MESGTRCSRAAFIRSAGIVQTAASMSISSHFAPTTSPGRAAVKMQNSKASAAMAWRPRKALMKAGTSA
jgi:hypothetical protein